MSKQEGLGGSGRPAGALGTDQTRCNDRREEPCAGSHS
jgi:hypothetical protein